MINSRHQAPKLQSLLINHHSKRGVQNAGSKQVAGEEEEERSPERRMVSRTRMACSSPSGRVCSGPVHTRPCASSTVPFGRGSPAGRYDSDSAGFRRAASSIHAPAPAATTPPRRHLRSPAHTTAPGRLGAAGETRPPTLPLGSGLRSRECMAKLAKVNAAEARRGTTRPLQPRI